MIGRILYRENVHGVLNYVFGKEDCKVLGFKNTYSEYGTDPKLFANVLHYLGQRHESPRRYAHITINLPHGEHLDDRTFYRLAQDYMGQMGYAKQPYVVVRHNDTLHEHIHIVSTTIQENGSMIGLSHDHRRNVAVQKYLERSYGLSPSPETKLHKDLPLFRLPEIQFGADDSNGTKFYIRDVVNGMLQRHKVRSFDQLAGILKPYHIVLNKMTNEIGRVGVAYGIDNQKKYRTQFINGYNVHPKLSGPKLLGLFEKNSKSKLLPMHKKRLEKQLMTTLGLFKSIRQEDLPDVLKSYQNIDCELHYGKKKRLKNIVIFDKSGYLFNASEISFKIDLTIHPKLIDDTAGVTCLDDTGKQFGLEVRKLIKNAFYEAYLKSNKSDMLLSDFVMMKNFKDVLPYISGSESYSFLNHYDGNIHNGVLEVLKNRFESTRSQLNLAETKKEIKTLENTASVLIKVLEANVFDVTGNKDIPFYLVQSLGLKYNGNNILYRNSGAHSVKLSLEDFHIPKIDRSYISTGSTDQNIKVLELLLETEASKDRSLNATAFFLPLMMPELYGSMNAEYRERFEENSLRAYLRTAEQLQIRYEKSPGDYIKLFNAKGFYFGQEQGKIYVSSIYSKYPVNIPLEPRTHRYLKSIKDLDAVLNEQSEALDNIKEKGRGQLEHLWLSHLIEKGLYGKAAFMMVYDGMYPNLEREVMEHHMGNGLRENIVQVSKQKIKYLRASNLRKGVYAFSALLGGGYKEEEVFNGFKDELTDFGKYKGNNRFV